MSTKKVPTADLFAHVIRLDVGDLIAAYTEGRDDYCISGGEKIIRIIVAVL